MDVRTISGFEEGNDDAIRGALLELVPGDSSVSTLHEICNTATERFLDAQGSGNCDDGARYGLVALVAANMLNGLAGGSGDEDLQNAALFQERAAGDALEASLSDIKSLSLQSNIERCVRAWRHSPQGRDPKLGRLVGSSGAIAKGKSGCLLAIAIGTGLVASGSAIVF